MDKIIAVESHGNALALNVNRLAGPQPHAATMAEAAAIARGYIALGYRVDIGLAQITDSNLPALGLSIEEALEPCANIAAGGKILRDCYARALPIYNDRQLALRAALRCYNTGTFTRGAAYEARYFASGAVPALAGPVRVAGAGRGAPNPYTAELSATGFWEALNDRYIY